jgi:uncharacterized protein (TIGR03067 family)
MFALSVVLCATSFLPAAEPADDAKAELARWQGVWEVELQVIDGKEVRAGERLTSKLVITGDTWEIHLKDSTKPIVGKIAIVLEGNTKGLDVAVGKSVYRALYLMDGDRAILRVGGADQDRPKDFSTSGGPTSGGIAIYKKVTK